MTDTLAWTLTGIEMTLLIVGSLAVIGVAFYVGAKAWSRGEGMFAACKKALWSLFQNAP